MKLKHLLPTSLLVVPAVLMVSSAQAAPVTGLANITGNVSVNSSSVLFQPSFTNGGAGAQETGSFAGLTGGTITQLTGGPVTGAVNIPGFIQFTGGVASPITFDLNFIAPGIGTLAGCTSSALATQCTPANSPFTLIQLSSNTVLASLQLNGTAYAGSASTGTTPLVSVFSTQAVNGTVPDIYNLLQNGGTLTGITYSASFTSAVPEPASLLLMGVALMGAGLFARRRAAR